MFNVEKRSRYNFLFERTFIKGYQQPAHIVRPQLVPTTGCGRALDKTAQLSTLSHIINPGNPDKDTKLSKRA
jgi:hypothetical protein